MATAKQDDWNEHWDRFSDAIEKNPAQRYRRRQILKAIRRSSRDNAQPNIVDIGAGSGDLLASLSRDLPDSKFLAVEPSSVGANQIHRKVPRASVLNVDLLNQPEVKSGWERWAHTAICSEVLEHVDQPVELLAKSRALLAPGASLIITVPGGPMSAFDKHIGHRMHYRPEQLRLVLEKAGFVNVQVNASGFPAFNLYKLLVILRGERLISDIDGELEGAGGRLAQLVMSIFNFIFIAALPHSRWGWQLVATAREPG